MANQQKHTGVLLINLGTPDSPSTRDVRRYLTEFLNDPRVIDINAFGRALLVNGIIVPFRAPKSAKIYKELWDLWGGESPLLTYGNTLQKAVQEKFKGENVTVEFAMRYQNPSIPSVLERMEKVGYDEIIILPLFPQYASASSGSAIEKALKIIKKWWTVPAIKIQPSFFNHEGFITAFVERAKQHDISNMDHVVFSYHGLPERQIDKAHPSFKCKDCNCDEAYKPDQELCYRNACFETTRLIAKRLNLEPTDYTIAFQSRLGKTPWLQPYADQVIEELGKKGHKNLLVFSAAFVSDCLETSIEIGSEYQEIFEEFGGKKVHLVESLNDSPIWIDTVYDIINELR
jgi:ferrochelatase